MAKRQSIRQTIVIPHRMTAETAAWLDPFRREQSTQTRLAYVRAAKRTVTKEDGKTPVVAIDEIPEKDVRHAVKALVPPTVGDSWTLNCAVRQGVAMRRAAPDGRAVIGSVGEMRRRTEGLVSHEAIVRRRLLPFVSYGDRLYRGNRSVKLVMTDAGGVEIAARSLPKDPLPKKHVREPKNPAKPRKQKNTWLRHAPHEGAQLVDGLTADAAITALRLTLGGMTQLIPLVRMRGKQGRLLAQVAWLASMGMLNVTFRVDDAAVHVTFDPTEVIEHPERRLPTSFVPRRCLGIDRNPNGIGGAVVDGAMRDGVFRPELQGKVVEHLLVVPSLDRYASAEETAEAMAKAADEFVSLARKRRCGLICVENLSNLRGGGGGRRLNHLLSRWCREKFADALRRRAALAGIEVVEVWGGYSTTIGNVEHDLPDACAAAAEMARRGLARREDKTTQLLPAFDEGYVPGRVETLAKAASRCLPPARKGQVRRKEGTGAAGRLSRAERIALLAEKAKHAAGWKELHRTIRKSGVRARRPHPARGSPLVAAAPLGPSRRGRIFRARCAGTGTSSPG